MRAETRLIYRCDYCNKISLQKSAMLRHEKACKKKPDIKIICFDCIFKDRLGEKFNYYESFDDNGELLHWESMYYSFSYCRKQKIRMIPYKAFVNRFLNKALKDKYDQIMPTVSTGCSKYISHESMNLLLESALDKTKSHDFLGAIEDYSIIIEQNPNQKYADTYFKRGMAKMKIQDYTSAIDDFNKVIEILPYNEQYYDYCIEAYELMNDLEGAEKMRERKSIAEEMPF